MKCKAILCLCSLLFPFVTDLCFGLVHAKACNRTVRTSVGWIRWTGRMGRCVVRIRAPLRDPQVIELRIRRLQVGTLRNSACEGAYIQLSDGIEDLEDDVGRYCGHVTGNATRLFLRKGPELSIVMDSEEKFAAERPVIFSAQFSVLPARLAIERHGGSVAPSAAECPLECSNKNYHNRQCRITSPGYPGVYPRGMRCRISLESSAGRFRIGGATEDVFNLMNYTLQDGCKTENCEDLHAEREERPEEAPMIPTRIDRRARRHLQSFDYRLDEDDEAIIVGSDVRQRRIKAERGQKSRIRNQRKKERGKMRNRNKKNMKKNNFKILDDDAEGSEVETRRSFVGFLDQRFARKKNAPISSSGSIHCVSDYLAIYENLDGKVIEIAKFCGEGRIPQIISRGRNIVVEFSSDRDGTIMHDGFQLTLREAEAGASRSSRGCDFVYKSSDRGARESIKSIQHWYPPSTLCSYKFLAKTTERVFVQLKIFRNDFEADVTNRDPSAAIGGNGERNSSSSLSHVANFCPGNEVAVYNGASSNDSLAWSYCDVFHSDINNIQVPVTSTGSSLLVQYYSAKGSFNGQEFTYGISYRFLKKPSHHHQHQHHHHHQESNNGAKRKTATASGHQPKTISLKPVNFSALNITEQDNCNCDFSTRIGTFKSWFIVLVVLGVISFIGAVLTIAALLTKCLKLRSIGENKLLQTPKR